jgi:phytanoyl-CoA hydroxylase
MFTQTELERFHQDGYIIVRALASAAEVAGMKAVAERSLAENSAPVATGVLPPATLVLPCTPVEYEADLHYPGAPPSRDAPGGRTVRRLLQAYARDEVFKSWATKPVVVEKLRQLLGPHLVLSQAHHNCIMTKQPHYSSDTLWHQDIRYWAFERPELVSMWLALGPESPENGGLYVLPGTHIMSFAPSRMDEAQFLRTDLAENRALIATQVPVLLAAGDVLFFHCRTVHAAGRNQTGQTKFSVVFTYHAADNHPLPGTRSEATPEITLS